MKHHRTQQQEHLNFAKGNIYQCHMWILVTHHSSKWLIIRY